MTTIFSDDEREKQVLDLHYNQRKNTRDIAKIMRMSFTKIGSILKKERERRERERENGNGKAEQHQIIPTTTRESEHVLGNSIRDCIRTEVNYICCICIWVNCYICWLVTYTELGTEPFWT